nr:trigger factor [Desulfobulbaceae bacterium]
MEVAVENIGALRRSMKIVLPNEFVSPKMAAAFKKIKSEVAIKGFRKGKVPQKVLEKSFGDRVKADLSEKLIQETYFDALAQVKLDAVVHPDIKAFDFIEDGSFSYEAEIEIKPEFELKQYKGIEVEHAEISVTDEEVEMALQLTRREMAPLKVVEDAVSKQDDLVIINFQGFHEGEAMKQIAGLEYPVDIGSNRNGKEFETMLLGLKKGEQVKRSVDFPADNANPLLAGKTIDFEITVKDVKERILADLDDDFAKDVSEDFKSLDDLRSSISEKIRKDKEKRVEGDITDKIVGKLIDAHDFDLPARLVAYEINESVKEIENNLQNQGLTLEAAGMNRDEMAKHFKPVAEKRVKGDFILKKIAEVEGIKLADADIEKGYARIAQQYNMSIPEVKEYFKGRNNMLPFMNELLSEKILAFVREEAKVLFVPEDQLQEKNSVNAGGGDK